LPQTTFTVLSFRQLYRRPTLAKLSKDEGLALGSKRKFMGDQTSCLALIRCKILTLV